MATVSITIEVDADVAKAFAASPAEEQRRLQLLLSLRLQELTTYHGKDMTIGVPNDMLQQTGLSEREAVIEFASRLFDAGRLDLFGAARLAALSRTELEAELRTRRIAIYRPTLEDIADDEAALRKLGA